MIIKKIASIGSITALSLVSGASTAAVVNIGFNPEGSTVVAGNVVTVGGSAGGLTGGSVWDVAIVLDSSGSMLSEGRQQLQQQAANALITSLPSSSSVSVVEYDRNANIVVGLTPVSTGLSVITNAVNATDARGGTDIRDGIEAASNELTVANNGFAGNPDTSRSQVMVVLSDGGSNSRIAHNAAQSAVTAGVSQVHSIGISTSHDESVMQNIVSGVDGIYNNSDDIGVYTDGSDLSSLVSLFSGGGTLVGLDRIEITLPDGTVLRSANGDFTIGALGNFEFDFQLVEGANSFSALAFGTDGSSASTSIVYNTIAGTTPTVPTAPVTPTTPTVSIPTAPSVPSPAVPVSAVPAAAWLFGSALMGLVGFTRRKK